MPPATRKSKNSGQAPAAPPTTQDVAPVGRSSRRQAAPTTTPIPPALTTAQTASSGDQARGFAGLSCMFKHFLVSSCSLLNRQQQLSPIEQQTPELTLSLGGWAQQVRS